MLLHQTHIQAKTKTNKYLQEQNAPSDTSNALKRQLLNIHSANSNAIKSLGTSLAWWAHNLLESIEDKIAQAQTLIQRHMNNAWSEMVSCSHCFALYYFSSLHWFTQIIQDNSYPSSDQYDILILTLFFLMLLSYIFLLTTSNLMLYLLQTWHVIVIQSFTLLAWSRNIQAPFNDPPSFMCFTKTTPDPSPMLDILNKYTLEKPCSKNTLSCMKLNLLCVSSQKCSQC